MRPERLIAAALGLTLLALSGPACKRSDDPGISSKARVMPKNGQVWGRDLATGLGLQEWELCQELGQLDCISQAHLITMGGVEPTALGIDQPLANAAVSAPIAVDRVAMAACGERYRRDQAGPAVIFGAILDSAKGADKDKARDEVASLLVQRLLAREATQDEVAALSDLYDAVEPISEDPDRDWAIGACMMVATSTEALFY